MPTPKNKNITPPRRPLWHGKKMWLILVPVLLIVGGVTAEAIRHNQNRKAIEADRARFVQADKDVQAVAAEIVANTSPEKSEVVRECTHQSRKFETEPLICGITFKALYGVENLSEANEIQKVVSDKLTAGDTIVSKKPTANAHNNSLASQRLPETDQKIVESEIYETVAGGMSCPTTYELYNSNSPPYYYEEYKASTIFSLVVMMQCNDLAKSQHYKLND